MTAAFQLALVLDPPEPGMAVGKRIAQHCRKCASSQPHLVLELDGCPGCAQCEGWEHRRVKCSKCDHIEEWSCGLPERDGMYKYVHLQRAPGDPERSSRKQRKGKESAWRGDLSPANIDRWRTAIMEDLHAHGASTFNALCVRIGDYTADVAAGKAPDEALWGLVGDFMLDYTTNSPVLFDIRRAVP